MGAITYTRLLLFFTSKYYLSPTPSINPFTVEFFLVRHFLSRTRELFTTAVCNIAGPREIIAKDIPGRDSLVIEARGDFEVVCGGWTTIIHRVCSRHVTKAR